MNIYERISQMGLGGPYEEKLYRILLNARYYKTPYETTDKGDDMALVKQSMWGWWKPRFLMDHRNRTAYEFMDVNYTLVTLKNEDVAWDTIPLNVPVEVIDRAKTFNAYFSTQIHRFQNGVADVEWQLNPDGRHNTYVAENFGAVDDMEISLWGKIDRTGAVVEPFRCTKSDSVIV